MMQDISRRNLSAILIHFCLSQTSFCQTSCGLLISQTSPAAARAISQINLIIIWSSCQPPVISTTDHINHWSYQPLVISTTGHINHCLYQPVIMSTTGYINRWSYQPLVITTTGYINQWSCQPLVINQKYYLAAHAQLFNRQLTGGWQVLAYASFYITQVTNLSSPFSHLHLNWIGFRSFFFDFNPLTLCSLYSSISILSASSPFFSKSSFY